MTGDVSNSSKDHSDDNNEESTQRIPTDEKKDETGSMTYPDRPGEPNCVYYLRTGMCAYGDDCKFNHPINNVQGNQYGGNHPERVGEPDCAYYMKTGMCKYGLTCKYNHPRDRNGAGPVELNMVGLPIRQGQESCSHYLITGSCKFGVTCKFHHPQPVVDGSNPPVSRPLPYAPTGFSGAHAWPCLSQQSYFPIMGHTQGWTPYIGNISPILSTNGLTYGDHVHPSTPCSNLPVRPSEPECRYFMKTGTCKDGSACKYHHPRENMVKTDASSFGPFGLPFRPGQPVCPYYCLYGICKYGSGCKYDHPLMVYSYNYVPGMTTLPMVDPSLLSYGAMNSSDSSYSKSLKRPSQTSEQISKVKLGTDDSSGDQVGSSQSSSQIQSG
ncbi:putative transcription factor C3H family [Helianthus anomalus]